jgi:hypothetical protein
MKLVFLLEEESMRDTLKGLLPRIVPKDVEYKLVPHEGIGALEKSIPIKLRNWREPGVRFIVVRDQERHPDCRAIKAKLIQLCQDAGRPDTLVRIVCRSLEAWFLGDLAAVERGLNQRGIAQHQQRADCREPDSVVAPVELLKRMAPRYQKHAGARAIGPHLDPENCRSSSFRAFVDGVRAMSTCTPSVPGNP